MTVNAMKYRTARTMYRELPVNVLASNGPKIPPKLQPVSVIECTRSEPFCQQTRQHAEVSAVGGLAQKYAYYGQHRVPGNAEHSTEDSETTYKVVCGLPSYLVRNRRETETATGVGQCGSGQNHCDSRDAKCGKQSLLL